MLALVLNAQRKKASAVLAVFSAMQQSSRLVLFCLAKKGLRRGAQGPSPPKPFAAYLVRSISTRIPITLDTTNGAVMVLFTTVPSKLSKPSALENVILVPFTL